MFGERIRNLRLSLNLSQLHLADRVGTTRKTVEKWETGKSEPKIAELISIADVFKISLDELVGREAELS